MNFLRVTILSHVNPKISGFYFIWHHFFSFDILKGNFKLTVVMILHYGDIHLRVEAYMQLSRNGMENTLVSKS